MDLWGKCPGCGRWFSVEVTVEDWACPTCGREPVRIRNRAGAQHGRPRRGRAP